ncbi:MAG: FHA domain-containing protein [Endomicrobium sp.]|jgi:pSer/pThr/pTyr-binding forkhead associated (FHA) protein/WD40 repeat protein|nr:FHA domain-containing protein [Endomicrobium sp.]
MAKLLLKRKAEILGEYLLKHKDKIFIGSKKSNDIVINDKIVSEFQCSIILIGGKYFVKAQNTLTGTKINGIIISEQEFHPGDQIEIASYCILYIDDSAGIQSEYYLLGIYGKFEGKKYIINNLETFIGREKFSPKGIENDIILSGDMTISKGHAKITLNGNQYVITDIGSTGGVAVNGVKVGQLDSMNINPGDEISIGRSIFRFVTSVNEDCSFPVKQHVLLLKIVRPVSIIFTIIVIVSSAALSIFGWSGISSLTKYKEKLSLELNLNFKKEVPLKRSEVYDITSTPAIGDITGNGHNSLVMLSAAGFIYGWDLVTGQQLWKQIELFNSDITSPMLIDVNNDGIKDIIVLSDSGLIFIFDGQTGNIIRKEVIGGIISEMTPLVADLNENGKQDIVVCSEDGTIHFLYNVGYENDYEKYSDFVEGPLLASPVLYKAKDISPMVVVANNNGKVYFIDGKTRAKKTVDLFEKTGKAHLIAGAPAVGDINGDGIPEVVVQTNIPQYVSAIDVKNFNVLWTFFVEPTPPADLRHNATPLISDGNVFVVSGNGTIYNLKGKTSYPSGELLWKLKIPNGKRMIGSPSKFDFDKDGHDDFVIGSEEGEISVIKNNTKRKEFEIISEIKASNSPITSQPLIVDAFGTGKLNILFVNSNNVIQAINTNAKTIKNFTPWAMFLGGPSHTPTQDISKYKLKYMSMFFGGILIFILFITFKVLRSVKKNSKKVKVKFL